MLLLLFVVVFGDIIDDGGGVVICSIYTFKLGLVNSAVVKCLLVGVFLLFGEDSEKDALLLLLLLLLLVVVVLQFTSAARIMRRFRRRFRRPRYDFPRVHYVQRIQRFLYGPLDVDVRLAVFSNDVFHFTHADAVFTRSDASHIQSGFN